MASMTNKQEKCRDISQCALAYIEIMLTEELTDAEANTIDDPLALVEIENSFYQVLTEKERQPPPTIHQHHPLSEGDFLLNQTDCVSQFTRGVEEASKFLPREIAICRNSGKIEEGPENGAAALMEGECKERPVTHGVKEDELSTLLDGLYLDLVHNSRALSRTQQQQQPPVPRPRKHTSTIVTPDLSRLVMSCARATASDDHTTAFELLKQIREQSTPFGLGSQRLAHYFANSLEARLNVGSSSWGPAEFMTVRPSASDHLKMILAYIPACPFPSISVRFATQHILNIAHQKTSANTAALHLIDFNLYGGMQWAQLIQSLSSRPTGPPKLRITCISHPEMSSPPQPVLEQTGQRLSNYCKHFNVPFEYDWVKKKPELIDIQDIKLDRNDAIVVASVFSGGFDKLLDEVGSGLSNCPRNAVLNLIHQINPDYFIHSVNSGSYSASGFLPRFRQAYYHYAALFDILQTTFPPHKGRERLVMEKIYEREILNIVACEGSERVERAETHRMWQSRTIRAGFCPVPLNMGLLTELKRMVHDGYHEDYVIEEDGHWLVQGWKGRKLCATSCWSPSPSFS